MEETTIQKSTRQSNFEILRILCMLAIVASHIAAHGHYGYTAPISNILIKSLIAGGQLACNIFILISGYFLIDSKFKINKLINLITQTLFYSTIIYIVMTIFNKANLSYYDIKTALFPISSGIYWFMSSYIFMYILSPFINKLIKSCNQKEHKTLVILLLLLTLGIKVFFKMEYFSNVGWFIMLYILAAYIKLYPPNKTLNSKLFNALVFLFSISSTILLHIFLNIQTFYLKNLLCFLSAFSIFNLFRTINIKSNRIINTLASATLGVYLIHDNIYLRTWLWVELLNCPTKASSNTFVLYAIFAIISIYICCTIIELLRQLLFKFITKTYLKIKSKHKKQ